MQLLSSVPVVAIGFICLWRLAIVTHTFFFSTLRSVPGPRWAKLSPLWLWLHDLKGTAPQVILDLHRKHGPIVRIAPNEVSIDDIVVHNTVLYNQGPKFMKAPYFYDSFLTGPPGVFQSTNQGEHSFMRRLVSKPFSRKNVLDFESEIHDSVRELTDIMRQLSSGKVAVDISKALRCLSLDFITRFTYGESMHAVQTKDFQEEVLDAFDSFAPGNFLFMMFPSLRATSIALLSMIPSTLFQAVPKMRKRVKRALEAQQNTKFTSDFRPLLQSEIETAESLGHPLSEEFLLADGVADIFAGTDTTSTSLILTLREIFMNEEVYTRLHEELRRVMPTPTSVPRLVDLEGLPFLSACVKEGLRYSTPVRSRLPRVTPPSGWTFLDHVIPPGTIISSSPHLMDYNEKVFPSPRTFIPGRWLSEDPATLKPLEDAWSPFSKGSRGCLGKSLAMAEIHITVATLVRGFRMARVVDAEMLVREVFGVIWDRPVRLVFSEVSE